MRFYWDYLEVEQQTGIPVWLFFLHDTKESSIEDLEHGSPPICPTGLFIESLQKLKTCVARPNYNRSMVYWNKDDLQELEEVQIVPSKLVKDGEEDW